ncbi:hypothetical protein [Streptomyces kurssanovii]|uniref:Uncharacterized protein n=1 Tax=Streptomyces kurssanovii TaxID=67312 RepID=A0ABV3HVM0_9ACTN
MASAVPAGGQVVGAGCRSYRPGGCTYVLDPAARVHRDGDVFTGVVKAVAPFAVEVGLDALRARAGEPARPAAQRTGR